jgi:hypothetical protein
MKKTLAIEWLILTGWIIFGLLVIPTFIYFFLSPAEYKINHSMIDIYKDLLGGIFGEKGIIGFWISTTIIFGSYLLFQFARSIIWAIKTIKKSL